jgi:hypothetical protein
LRLHTARRLIFGAATNARTVPVRYALAALLFFAASLLLAACNRAPSDPETALAESDSFAVVMGRFPASEDQPPGLDGDSLVVRVRYLGDCEENTWTLVEALQGDAARLALHRDGGGDECTGEVYDELRFGVSQEARQARQVELLGPDGVTYPLR